METLEQWIDIYFTWASRRILHQNVWKDKKSSWWAPIWCGPQGHQKEDTTKFEFSNNAKSGKNKKNKWRKILYWTKVVQLDQLDTSTTDEINLGKPFAILCCYRMALNYPPFFGQSWLHILKPILNQIKFVKLFGFLSPFSISFKLSKPKQTKYSLE